MKTGNKPAPPRSSLANIQPSLIDLDIIKQAGWTDQQILVVAVTDERLTWYEREFIKRLGRKLYGENNPSIR